MKSLVAFAATAAVLTLALLASTASAEDETVTLQRTITVYGRAARPSVTIMVSRERMQLPVTTPTLSAVTKIHDASKKDPL